MHVNEIRVHGYGIYNARRIDRELFQSPVDRMLRGQLPMFLVQL